MTSDELLTWVSGSEYGLKGPPNIRMPFEYKTKGTESRT